MKHLLIAGTAMLALTACGGSAEKTASEKIADISTFIETNQDSESLTQAEADLDEVIAEASNIIAEANTAQNNINIARSKPTVAKGLAFLKDNATADGVITTDSGLQYKVVQSGLENGAQAAAGQDIAAHYHGYFIDGEVFDSSYKRGQPLIGPSNGFIKGWNESFCSICSF